MNVWRLLIDPALDGAHNMAVDDLLLEGQATERPLSPPTLRLYAWKPVGLSLGRTQKARGTYDPEYLRANAIDLIRRPTGGTAVLHADERTYAVCGALDGPFAGGVVETYRAVARALARGLSALGLEVGTVPGAARVVQAEPSCFESISDYELAVGHRKLVGSAQYRRRRGFLQHGSIPFRLDPARIAGALGCAPRTERFTDLETELGFRPSLEELDAHLIRAFEETFEIRLEPGELSAEEALRVEQLRCWKYESTSWTLDGKVGEGERRWGPNLT